ncbi:MAG: hypothetical protein ACT4N2_06885 [Hyphomicrobium sp.]
MAIRRMWMGPLAVAAAAFLGSASAKAAEIIPIQTEIYDNLSNLSIDVDSGLGFNLKADGEVRCNYLLNGPIERGDLDRLKAAIKPYAERGIDNIPRLCLNSPGGIYIEGLAISRYLMDENIGTSVPASAICYSACALIFMGGTYPWKGEINRFLHVAGDVGFHAPYVKGLPDEQYNNEAMAEAYKEGVQAIRNLVDLGVGNQVRRFPPELLAELLAKGKDEVYSIDTVGKAIRLRVHIYGAIADPPIDKAAFCNVCINMNYDAMESYGRGGANDLCTNDTSEHDVKSYPGGKRWISDLAPRGGTCAIDIEMKGGKPSQWMFVDSDADWKDGLELAYWYLYSSNTPLKSLSDGKNDPAITRADGSVPEIKGGGGQGADIATVLIDFIKAGYLGHGMRNHVTPETVFAAEVDYYDKGRLTRAAVAAEHQSYYAKWPERSYEMIADSLSLNATSDTSVEASFRYAYHVANGSKSLIGLGVTYLTIELRDGKFQIVRETGNVVSRN